MIFGTWNVQGASRKMSEITLELKQQNVDIAVITETKKKGKGSENLGYYDHFYSGVDKDKRAQQGVSILIQRNLRKFITTWEAISERIIKMNLALHGHKVTVLGIYAINDDALVTTKENFFEQLNREISKIGNTREIIVLGDMNSRTGKKINDKVVGQHGEETTNDNGTRLITMCEQNELRITNGFYPHRTIHKYTWTQATRNLKSIIDYAITRQKSKLKVKDVRAYRGATCGSDHYLLKTKIVFPVQQRENGYKSDTNQSEQTNEKKFNLDSLDNDSTKTLYKNRLDEKLGDIHFETTELQHQYIKDCIQTAAMEALGYSEKTQRKKPYWWDEEIEMDIMNKKKKYISYLNTKSNEDETAYKEAQKIVRRKIAQKKNESWEKKCNKINMYIGGQKSTEGWKAIKELRQNKRKDLISPIPLTKWDEYYKDLLTENRDQFKDENVQPNIHTAASPIRITTSEVAKACKDLKNGKAPGPGNIPAELIKNGTSKLYQHLTNLFQTCMNGREIPMEWKTSILSTIHKKGNKENCDNYRGIAVTSTLSRIYGKLLKIKMEQEYRDLEAEEQAGFRAGRSTVDHLFCVSQIIEKKTAFNQEVHLLYVDLRKAYDSVPHNKLWEALEKTNISVTLIKAAKRLYEDVTTKIKMGNKLSNGFTTTKGLKQGCCLSPTLFKIYLEQTLKTWKRKCQNMGISLNDTTLYTLCFADDQIVLAQDYEDLEYMTRKLIEEYNKWGLDVNLEKTRYMCIGGVQQDLILEDGQIIKNCKDYKYLGMKITNDGTLDQTIKERNIQGRQAISMMNGILWDQQISKQNKHRIYNSIIKTIVTYSSEVWQIKEKSERTLMATEMDFWRRAAGKSKLERYTNERIREIMGVTHTIADEVRVKQLRWYGHVQRMPEERLPKQIFKYTPQGRRKRGRPRRSWREGIDKELRERGVEEDLWMDREEWRLEIGRRRRTF